MQSRSAAMVAAIVALTAVVFLVPVAAQTVAAKNDGPAASWVVVPQSRAFHCSGTTPTAGNAILISGVATSVTINEQVATTIMDIDLVNQTARRVEAELMLPVPPGAAVKAFSFQGAAQEPTAELLPADQARRTYQSIVSKLKDPALLEFAGYNTIRSSVFPIEARGNQRIRVTYEQILTAHGERVDYVIPRSESLSYNVPWNISVRIQSRHNISTVYSPSHPLDVQRRGAGLVSAKVKSLSGAQPGPFRLSYLLEGSDVTASLFSYPDVDGKGGYFLLLAGLPVKENAPASTIKRDLTLVIDRSGSMNGEKIEQVREAARQIIEGLAVGEAFNIITYNDSVELFSQTPVVKSKESMVEARAYLQRMQSGGGTNLHDALAEALRIEPREGYLPIVLFLTDGLPTVGVTSEAAITKTAVEGNTYKRRVFTFGVGVDVNTPLLEKVATESRATATFVLPQENVEVKVGRVFKRLAGPMLADTTLDVIGGEGTPDPRRVGDVLPGVLPDLFVDDQLVVLGKFFGSEPLHFRLGGNYLGETRKFEFTFDLGKTTYRNGFVPRLWASRKIAVLTDAIRDLGAAQTSLVSTSAKPDPRMKELVDEIVALSTEFGILTEYTAFLAQEGTDLTNLDDVLAVANGNFADRCVNVRCGVGSVNQDINRQSQRSQTWLNPRNGYFDANMNSVNVVGVQQVNDRAFFRRGNKWVDSRLVNGEKEAEPTKTISFGSDEYNALEELLSSQGRSGCISLQGDILMKVSGETILIQGPKQEAPPPPVTPAKEDGC